MVEFGWSLIAGDIFTEPGVNGKRYDEVETMIGTVRESEVIFEAWGETNFIVDVAVGCLVVVRARLVFVVVVVDDDDVVVVVGVSDEVVFRVALVVPSEFAVTPRFRRIGP